MLLFRPGVKRMPQPWIFWGWIISGSTILTRSIVEPRRITRTTTSSSADRWIDEELAELLVSLRKRLPDTVWYAPLAVGRHVDHQIVCSAADRLTQLGAKVNLYEDIPYVAQRSGSIIERLEEFGNSLEPGLVEMSEMLPLRLQAAAKYASQTRANFPDEASMFKTITSYAHSIRPVETVHLERYWSAR